MTSLPSAVVSVREGTSTPLDTLNFLSSKNNSSAFEAFAQSEKPLSEMTYQVMKLKLLAIIFRNKFLADCQTFKVPTTTLNYAND
ncbi:unnamed protein product [Dovyalis caffra]|uniref:Uncharacterized protein n=1 Tax=Dovyalis caffra TaxID=77055 RepID=A0AAV1QPC1_9ROSI|nr:unnamed protein product [Dovyalis caffra]